MSSLNILVNRSYNGSTIIEVARPYTMLKSRMKLVIPEFVILESQGFTSAEQSSICIALIQRQKELLEKQKITFTTYQLIYKGGFYEIQSS